MQQFGWLLLAIYKLLYVSLLIKVFGFTWIKKKLTFPMHGFKQALYDVDIATQLHESVRMAARCLPFKAECLPKSIVLVDMLRKRGIAAELKLGVGREQNGIKSHAWVSVSNKNISEPDELGKEFVELKF